MDVAVGWAIVIMAIWLWRSDPRRSRISAVLAAIGVAWVAGGVLHRGPLAHFLLAWPAGRLGDRWNRLVIALAYVDAVVETVVRVDGATFVYAAILVGAGVLRVFRSSGVVRRGRLLAGAGAVLIGGVLVLGRLSILAGIPSSGDASLAAYAIGVPVVIIAMLADLHWGSLSRSAVTGLVVDLGSQDDAASLRTRLAAALGDPSLTVAYAVPGDRFVDDSGAPVELPVPGSGRVATPVRDGSEAIALIVHDAAVLDDPAIVLPVASATRLAVANVSLRREIERRRAAIDASQRRLVAAADNQRQRIERRLADGALARLRHVRTLLEDPAVSTATAGAPIDLGREVRAAERELRAFARGIYPRTLHEAGLAAAVAELVSTAPTRVDVEIPADRFPPEIESAAYFVCAEALANAAKYAAGSQVSVRGSLSATDLRITIVDDGPGGADLAGSGLRGLRDRVEAVGATLTVQSHAGKGTIVEVVLPRVGEGAPR